MLNYRDPFYVFHALPQLATATTEERMHITDAQ